MNRLQEFLSFKKEATLPARLYSMTIVCIVILIFSMAWIVQGLTIGNGIIYDWSGFLQIGILLPSFILSLGLYFSLKSTVSTTPLLISILLLEVIYFFVCYINGFLPVSVFLGLALAVYLVMPIKIARICLIMAALSYGTTNGAHFFHDEYWQFGRFILLGLVSCGVFDCWSENQFNTSDDVRRLLIVRYSILIGLYSALMILLVVSGLAKGELINFIAMIFMTFLLFWFNRKQYNVIVVVGYIVFFAIMHVLQLTKDPLVNLAYSLSLIPLLFMWLPLRIATFSAICIFAYDLVNFIPVASIQMEAFLGRVFFNYIITFFIFWSLLWALGQSKDRKVNSVLDLYPISTWWHLYWQNLSVLILLIVFILSIPFLRISQSGEEIINDMDIFFTSSFTWLWGVIIVICILYTVMIYTNSIWTSKRVTVLYEKAKQSEKVQAAFLSNMSHEMRTPLNSIIGMARAVKFKNATEYEQKQFDLILLSGRRLKRMVDDTLELIRIEKGSLHIIVKRFSPYSTLSSIIENYLFSIDPNLTITHRIEFSPQLFLMGDATRIQQILDNLLHNAVKFTIKGCIDVTCDYQLGELSIVVADTGVGIASDTLDRIFEPYFQADMSSTRLYQGAGVGLAVTKELVERMAGRIEISSELGKGSTFSVYLPMSIALD